MAEPPIPDRTAPRYSDEQVDDIVGQRAVIEQAKGMIMYVHGVTGAEAFETLRHRARRTNVKIRTKAQQILDDPALADGT